MNKFLGLLAILFGIIGTLVCFAGDVMVWRFTEKVTSRTRIMTERADDGLRRTDSALDRFQNSVSFTSVFLKNAQKRAEALTTENAPKETQQRILQELLPHLERANAVGDVTASFANLMENIASLVDQENERSERGEQLRSASAKLTAAADQLHALTSEIETLLAKATALTPKALVALIIRAAATVLIVDQAVSSLKGAVGTVQKDVQLVRSELDFWFLVVPILITFVLTWIAIGQLCLVNWGRRRFQRPSSA